MDYDVVRDSVRSAYKYFAQNDNKFHSSMEKFYEEGEKIRLLHELYFRSK